MKKLPQEDSPEEDAELLKAAAKGDLKKVKTLVERGADLEAKDKETGRTPFMMAMARRKLDATELDVAEFLLEKGAKIDATDKRGNTALMEAAVAVPRVMIQPVIIKPEKVRSCIVQPVKVEPLVPESKKFEKVKFLIDHGADLNKRNKSGLSALGMVVKNGGCKFEVAKLLLEKGADVNVKDTRGFSVLMLAVEFDELDIIKLLLEKRAKVNEPAIDGTTALSLARRLKHDAIVQLLLDNGAKE